MQVVITTESEMHEPQLRFPTTNARERKADIRLQIWGKDVNRQSEATIDTRIREHTFPKPNTMIDR